MDFLAMMKQAGFDDVEMVGDTGFNSSPKTKGVLFRAVRPLAIKEAKRKMAIEESLNKYREFFELAYAEGALDRKTKHLIALGASLGAGCEP